MKTITEWLRTLPEPYRSAALNQPKEVRFKYYPHSTICRTLYSAIDQAFLWSDTEQGADYWTDVQQRASRGEFDKQDLDCTIPEEKETT